MNTKTPLLRTHPPSGPKPLTLTEQRLASILLSLSLPSTKSKRIEKDGK